MLLSSLTPSLEEWYQTLDDFYIYFPLSPQPIVFAFILLVSQVCSHFWYVCLGSRRRRAKENYSVYQLLVKQWQNSIRGAITPATRRALDTAWQRWVNWCSIASRDTPGLDIYNPTLEVYCTFINFYLSLYTPSTVES